MLGGGGSYDDLTYSHALGKIVAAPEGTGRVFIVDPESMAVTMIAVIMSEEEIDLEVGYCR